MKKKNFFARHKVGIIVLCVIAAIIIGITVFINRAMKEAQKMLAAMQYETVVAEKRDLSEVVAASGTVISKASHPVSAEVSKVKVKSINVSVGDHVNEGDLLCSFYTDELEKQLEEANHTLKNTKASANITLNSASRSLNETKADADIAKERNDKKLSDAKKEVEDYEALKNQAYDQYWHALEEEKKYEQAVQTATQKVAAASAALNSPDVSGSDFVDATNAFTAAKAELDSATAAYSAAQSASAQHLANYNQCVTQINQIEGTYDQLKQANEDADRKAASLIASGKDTVNSASISKDNTVTAAEKTVADVEEMIAACNVYAPASGIVTSISLTTDDTYMGNPILTIEDTSSYEVETLIDEYEISKIKVGQKAVIKTNGTGDEILNGKVIEVSPRAVPGGNNVVYRVLVSIDTKNDNLRLDMTAKLSIILNETPNTLTVPFDAVQYDENEAPFVEKKNAEGSFDKIMITVGTSNDYYVEIASGDIKEGDEIKVMRELGDFMDLESLLYETEEEGGF